MFDLLRKDVFGEIIDAHKAKLFDTDVIIDRLSSRMLTLSTFITSTVTFIRCNTDTAIKQREYSTAFTTDHKITVKTYNDVDELPPSSSDSGSDEQPSKKLSKGLSKRHFRRRFGWNVKRHSVLPKSSENKYDSCSVVESEEEDR